MPSPIDNVPRHLLDQYKDDLPNMFFFAGAGISIASSIPDVPGMLSCTADVFLPSNINPRHRNKILGLQPEIIYEAIIRITGSRESLHLWKALHPKTQVNYGLACCPNIAHLFIVEHAASYNVPIFTTNFDTMFEQAAKILGLEPRVYLPNDSPPNCIATGNRSNSVAICKLHGSICDDTGNYTPKKLLTTITEISSINVPWLETISTLMKRNYICFVGYSGRDIDLFPEIKRFSSTLRHNSADSGVYWINHFDNDPSDNMSKECDAIRIEGVYPSDVFMNLALVVAPSVDSHDEWERKKALKVQMLKDLKRETIEKNLISDAAKRLLAAELVAKSGKYNDAERLLTDVENRASELSPFLKCEMLLFRARLSHELSRYETCLKTAKMALALATSMTTDGVDFRIQSRCVISEAYRMLIPNDTYFPNRVSWNMIPHLLWTLCHFQLVEFINGMDLKATGKKSSPHSQHEMIEHSIRQTAMIQSVLGNPFKGWPEPAKKLLFRRWKLLRKKSRMCGYAGGIANSGKFLTRLVGDEDTRQEMDKVFDLLTHVTGLELSLRNKADNAIQNGNWDEARGFFTRYYRSAKKSGNRLNAIKALVGRAYISKLTTGVTSLEPRGKREFERLISQVEGTFWQAHLSKLNSIIVSQGLP